MKTLIAISKETKAGIVVVGVNVFEQDIPSAKHRFDKAQTIIFQQDQAIRETLNVKLRQSAWGKLYSKTVFENLRFPVGKLYEDLAVVFQCLTKTDAVAFNGIQLYNYQIRKGSIMCSSFNIRQLDEIEIIEGAMEFLLKYNPGLYWEARARKVYSYFIVLYRILGSKDRESCVKEREMLKQKISENAKGLIFKRGVRLSLKIKIVSFWGGERVFFSLQKCIDWIRKIRSV